MTDKPTDARKVPKLIIMVTALVVFATLAVGAFFAFRSSATSSRYLTPEQAKDKLWDYLHERSNTSEFKPSLDISKEKRPWRAMEPFYAAPPDYKTVYRLIGEHLTLAETILKDPDVKRQQDGVRVIIELCNIAKDVAVDPWLASRMCDAYILPLAENATDPKSELMRFAANIYREANETGRLLEMGRTIIAKNPSGERADDIRYRLGQLLVSQGDYKGAIEFLRGIKNPRYTNEVSRRIASLEQRSQQKR
jgi:hypothetical protein